MILRSIEALSEHSWAWLSRYWKEKCLYGYVSDSSAVYGATDVASARPSVPSAKCFAMWKYGIVPRVTFPVDFRQVGPTSGKLGWLAVKMCFVSRADLSAPRFERWRCGGHPDRGVCLRQSQQDCNYIYINLFTFDGAIAGQFSFRNNLA